MGTVCVTKTYDGGEKHIRNLFCLDSSDPIMIITLMMMMMMNDVNYDNHDHDDDDDYGVQRI